VADAIEARDSKDEATAPLKVDAGHAVEESPRRSARAHCPQSFQRVTSRSHPAIATHGKHQRSSCSVFVYRKHSFTARPGKNRTPNPAAGARDLFRGYTPRLGWGAAFVGAREAAPMRAKARGLVGSASNQAADG
jgi:hypothetical protein